MPPARTVAGVAFMWIAGEGGTILDGVGYKAGKSDTPLTGDLPDSISRKALRFELSVIETKTMAKSKLKNTAITANDLTDFVANNSDFDFEMRVLEKLRSLNFACEYSGTYQDPVTDKVRQFDIRARKMQGVCTLAVAVECKNLRPTNPLLLSAVPRTATEAAHDLLLVRRQHGPAYPRVETIKGASSAYKEGQMVGKKTDQVGRVESTGELSSDDAETFDKLNQAVNSCKDLIRDSRWGPDVPLLVNAIVPVFVVPDGVLWQVDYDQNGVMRAPPRNVSSTTLYYGHAWKISGDNVPIVYTLSHVEVITISALPDAVAVWMGPSGFFSTHR
jgi:hypothetical protein